ncbi:hypothetical protein OL229_21855 [Neisseriaceae bacterium JH1-16]|nr:hypothetical protein [Neisseriaceae bacterium JH1-16]
MTASAPLAFATALAPQLTARSWAIGGSALLHRLGLAAAPDRLELVTTAADFAAMAQTLAEQARDISPDPHPDYAPRHFARFETADGLQIELVAEMAIRLERGVFRWPFDATAIEPADGLPWCCIEDWALLYRLLGDAESAALLDGYLDEHGIGRPDRLADFLDARYPETALEPLPDWWPWDE